MSMQPSIDLINDVTENTFDSLVLEGSGPRIVEFMSYGCSHCHAMEPVLQQAAEKMKAKEKFFRVNIGLEQGLAERFNVQGTPTLILFQDGQIVATVEGPRPQLASLLAVFRNAFQP